MAGEELGLLQEKHATIKPNSNVASYSWKENSESRIKLRNLEILKKNAGKIESIFVIGAAPCAEKLTGPLLKKKETNDNFKRI